MAPPKIFVSHSHYDDAFASWLVRDLRAAGTMTWLDNDVDAGNFLAIINEALAASDWFLLVLTRNALASPWVRQEVDAAIALKNSGRIRGLIFFKARPVDHQELPPLWQVFSIIDATLDYVTARDRVLRVVEVMDRWTSPPRSMAWQAPPYDPYPLPRQAAPQAPPFNADPLFDSSPLPGWLWPQQTPSYEAPSWSPQDSSWPPVQLPSPDRSQERMRENTTHSISMQLAGGQFAEALAECEQYLQQYPNDSKVWHLKAEALRSLGRTDEAKAADSHAGTSY